VSRRNRGLALLVLGLAAGCRPRGVGETGGRLEVRWTGASTAAFAAPASAEWCDSLNLLEIRAIAGDTGVGLAVYHQGGIAPGTYRVFKPELAGTMPSAAAVGLRWYSRTAVQGFQGTSGELSLRRAPDGTLAGRFTAKASSITDAGKLTVAGSFEGLRERRATRGCYAPPPPDTSERVH
jgi:hypothetical protein